MIMCCEIIFVLVDWRTTTGGDDEQQDPEPDVDDEVLRRKVSKRLDRKKTKVIRSRCSSDMKPGDTEPDVSGDDDEVPRRKLPKKLDRKKAKARSSVRSSHDTEPDVDSGDEVLKRKVPKRLDRKNNKATRSRCSSDIEPDDSEPDVSGDDDEVPRRKVPKKLDRKKANRSVRSSHDTEPDVDSGDEVLRRKVPKHSRDRKKIKAISDMESDNTETDVSGEDEVPKRKLLKRFDRKKSKANSGIGDYESKAEKNVGRRRNCPWTNEDLSVLRKSFQKFFKLRRPPDFPSIEAVQANFPQLQKRSKAQLKSRVWHLIQT